MVRRFLWAYTKAVLAIAISIAFGWLLLGWKYGFQTLLRIETLNDMVIDLIIILVFAFVATIAYVALEDRKR